MSETKIHEQTSHMEEKEIKSKYHSNKIFSITDLDDIDEIKEYTQKIEEEARLMELPKTQDFQ